MIAPSADHSPLRKIAGGALDDGDWSVRQAGVETLASLRLAAENIKAVAARLGDSNSDVRAAARVALEKAPLDAATEAEVRVWARGALDDGDWSVRQAGVETLAWLVLEAEDVKPVAARLVDSDSNVRAAAVAALVAPDAPSWDLQPAFVDFATREAARMTLSRTSAWDYVEGTLLSFLDQAPRSTRDGDESDDQDVAFALALRSSGIAPDGWLPMLDLAPLPGAGPMARFLLRLLARETQRPLLDVVGAPQLVTWDRIGSGSVAAKVLFEV